MIMKFFLPTLYLIILISGLTSCYSAKDITGKYRSNFAALGFFITEISLNKDSTFEYHCYGDILNQKSKGHYTIKKGKLYMAYEFRPADTSNYAYFRGIGWNLAEDDKKWKASFPKLFFIRHHKLFASRENGEIIRRVKPKSIFYNHKRRYYLERVP